MFISILKKTLVNSLPFMLAVTGLGGIAFGCAQFVMRQSANDPQTQVVADSVRYMKQGQEVTFAGNQSSVDVEKSLSLFMIQYDSNRVAMASSGTIDGKIPSLPLGVFDVAKKKGENRVTWEPKKGVRIAAVIQYFNGTKEGYLLAGRNLTEIESRIHKLLAMVTAATLGLDALVFLAILITNTLQGRTKKL